MIKKVIASLGIKNEEWIIEKTLRVLDRFCDKIIIVDDATFLFNKFFKEN